MAEGARAAHAQRGIGSGAGDRNGVVGSGVADRRPCLGFLEVRHVTGHAAAPRRVRGVLRVRRRIGRLAGMVCGALTVVESAGEGPSLRVPIALRMRIVATRARHAPGDVARRVEVALLIGKGADAAIGEVCLAAELREARRVELLERLSRDVPLAELVLEGVALPADT